METQEIAIRGARVHNLKNVQLVLPKNRLICFTGVSGSGKSSLAFDTLYAEGQRRYVTSLSAYARQFLGQMEKPDVDQITGLAPTISIAQKTAGRNPRSTVGTITEIYDYLRILFARVGTPHCTQCGQPIGAQSRDQIVARIRTLPVGSRLQILSPVVQERKGEYHELFADLQKSGYIRVRIDGQFFTIDQAPALDRYSRHNIEVVVDRLILREKEQETSRLAEAVDNALRLGQGTFIVARQDEEDILLSSSFDCPACGISYQEPTPQSFSFNNPQGMCPDCSGLGTQVVMREHLMVPDPSRTIRAGALEPLGAIENNRWRLHLYEGAAEHLGFDLDTPWEKLDDAQKHDFLYGLGEEKITFTYTNLRKYTWSHEDKYEGVVQFLEEKFRGAKERERRELEQYMGVQTCAKCDGGRLRPESLAIKINDRNMPQLTSIAIEDARDFFAAVRFEDAQALIAEEALKEIRGRVQLMCDMGLGYLTLDRGAHTLSGGEAQRIRLASQIGSGLVGVLYILDEPSIGLHHRDNERLLATLKRLRDIGNTVIVVEHDEETMREADLIVDFGPGAGERGGELIVCGPPSQVERSARSITGRYLAGKEAIPIPSARRQPNGKWLEIQGACQHNLKEVEARIPLGLFTCVTGVSGSGKSSLINDIVFKELDRRLHRAQIESGRHQALNGSEHLDKVIRIDQKPIGRTPRSNAAPDTAALPPIRQRFAKMTDARLRDDKQGRFSFNVKGGRCEACEGNGANLVEMEFLADLWVTCEACEGRRFNRETQSIKYKDKSIADVLAMEVEEALGFFANVPPIHRVMQTLHDVGLGYIKLGQPAPTLSGGEAQRIKLAKELCRRNTGRTLYILDEPTTGLHFADVDKLLRILHTFADQGNTVIVIEHNMEVVKTADYILDLGPEGGEDGGLIVASGTPEAVAKIKTSYTGQALQKALQPTRSRYKAVKKNGRAKTKGWIRQIEILGARQHNLRNINVTIPRDQLTVISGVSGSGKSTLAFDTLYAEGQRRYVESLSAYARQFLEQMEKPKVERVSGLSPAIAIEQKAPSRNPRSTVGTVTETYDYIRALYATIGVQHCPNCQVPVGAQTAQEMVDRILQLPEKHRILILAPIEPRQNEGYEALLERARSDGFARARIDGEVHELGAEIQLERRHRHRIELVVDRLAVRARERGRLNESVERALELSGGELVVASADEDREDRLSRRYSCPGCGTAFPPLSPQRFSFNHQQGWCVICEGLGLGEGVDREWIVTAPQLSVREGAIEPWGPITDPDFARLLEAAGTALGFELDTPYGDLSAGSRRALLYGAPNQPLAIDDKLRFCYRGVLPTIDEHARNTQSHKDLLGEVPCSACEGSRLNSESRSVYLRGKSIVEITRLPITESLAFFREVQPDEREQEIAGELLQEVRTRLDFLERVGLGYIDLERRAATLSGGESQRIRLASQIGSGLTGVLYLLDEPTIGLHPRDNRRLLDALKDLKDLGNTVVLVEHDRSTLDEADHIIDLGPGAGSEGGHLVAYGAPAEFGKGTPSHTGAYLRDELHIPIPTKRRKSTRKKLAIKGARQHNLKNIDAHIPLGQFVCITGVSGSGKSSLVTDVLFNALASELHHSTQPIGEHDSIEGIDHIDKVINIDQAPIGHSPRSTPATIMGVFDLIRQFYTEIPEAKVRGFTAGRFSFNKPGGRCETCEGLGQRCIEMHFLPDVWVECDNCRGKRYIPEVLEVQFKGHSITSVLEMPIRDNLALFDKVPRIRKRLQIMDDVGLGYLSLGQSSTTLSGGEAQRLKLAAELCRPDTGQTLYLLDEPTTGLHFADIERLLTVLHRLVDAGNTMVVIEHNMDVIKTADYLIDLGPEGGDQGGTIVATGPPETIARNEQSHTGRILAEVLEQNQQHREKAGRR